jgi:type I restriction enzyme S subunit
MGDLFKVKHGFAFDGKYFSSEGEYILLSPGNFRDAGGFKLKDKEKYFTGDIPEEYLLRKGDLLVAMTEQAEGLLGSSALIPASNRFLHNQRLGLIVDWRMDELDLHFLYYLFNTREVRTQIRASATGAKVRHTSPSRIGEVRVAIPPLFTQHKIASILSAYDDLIENNTRRIAILEEMAQSLYREWFVEFRFPGHEKARLVDSPLGKIPEGWEPWRLEKWACEVRRAVDPSAIDPTTPYFGLEHLPRRSITLGEWGQASDVQSTKLAFREGEILFGKIRPYFHKVGVAPVNGVCSTDAIVIAPSFDEAFAPVVCCVSSDDFVRHATQTAQGTKMPRANWSVLLKYPLPHPPPELLADFNASFGGMESQMRVLMRKNRNLRTTRDLLLPKLISGQLDVGELDIETGEPLVEATS